MKKIFSLFAAVFFTCSMMAETTAMMVSPAEQLQSYINDLTALKEFVQQFNDVEGASKFITDAEQYIYVGNAALASGDDGLIQNTNTQVGVICGEGTSSALSISKKGYAAQLDALLIGYEDCTSCQAIIDAAKVEVNTIEWDNTKNVSDNIEVIKKNAQIIINNAKTKLQNSYGTCGENLTWEYNEVTTTLTITGTGAMTDFEYAGSMPWNTYKDDITNVNLPNGIKRIGKCAFYECSKLESVTIPSSVESIGQSAFFKCTSMNPVTFAAGSALESIEKSAFSNCSGLESITIPEGVETIGETAFYGCTGLTSIDIPGSVESIGPNAFLNCSGLTSISVAASNTVFDSRDNCNAIIVSSADSLILGCKNTTIPNTVTIIGDRAFQGCAGRTSIPIPAGVTSIGDYAFAGCTDLESIIIPEGVTSIGEYTFNGCSSLESITIPAGVTTIGKRAFQNCSTLEAITLPINLTTIGEYAFYGCSGLTSVTIPNSVTSIGVKAFNGCTNLTNISVCWLSNLPTPKNAFDNNDATLHVPSGYATTYGETSPWSSFINIVADIPAGQCGDNLYWVYNPSTTTLTITGTGDMYDYAAANTSAWHSYKFDITSVVLPDGITHIGDYAFYYCDALPSITIPNSVITIGKQAFQFCDALTSIIIPASVTGIGENAFNQCANLATLTFAAGVTSIGDGAFWGCSALTDVTVNWTNLSGITTHADAFYGLTLANVNLHVPAGTYATYAATAPWNGFKILDPSCYGQCGDNLYWSYNPTTTTLTITGSGAMNSYSYGALKGAPWYSYRSSITSIVLPDGLTTIGDYAFIQCTITSITIPESVTSIGTNAFEYSHLTSIEIKSSEFNIGKEAFRACNDLSSVTIRNSAATIGTKAFYHCENITFVIIQNSEVSIGEYAFSECYNLVSFALTDGSTLTSIGKSAFYKCRELTSITIPNTVTNIGNDAFRECTDLTDIYVSWADPSTECEIGEGIFSSVPGSAKLHLPFEAWNNYSTHARWTKFKQVPMVTAKTDPENDGVFYNTFYHGSVAYALPAGVEAYTAKRSGENMILTKVAGEGQTLPANTAVILKSTVQQYEMYPSDDTPVTVGENDLQGVEATEAAPANCYVLSDHSTDNSTTGVGFYAFSGDLTPYKAYVVLPSGQNNAPQRLRFVFETTTDVEQPTSDSSLKGGEKILRDGILYIKRGEHMYNAQGGLVD